MKPLIAIDYDGTLVRPVWPNRDGEWMPGALEALRELDKHARIVIHTSRIAPVLPDGVTPRSPADVYSEIEHLEGRLREIGMKHVSVHTQPWKPNAAVFVDDRAVHYAGRKKSWENIVPKILTLAGVNHEMIVKEMYSE